MQEKGFLEICKINPHFDQKTPKKSVFNFLQKNTSNDFDKNFVRNAP